MKLQIVKDGEIQGSFVATMITAFVFVMFCLGFFVEEVRTGWDKFGATLSTVYLGQLGIWLGYKSAKNIWGSDTGSDTGVVAPPALSAPPKLSSVIGPLIVEPWGGTSKGTAKGSAKGSAKEEEVDLDLDKGGN